jgi:acetoacetyl-CoA synthetase
VPDRTEPPVLWEPSEDRKRRANVTCYTQWLEDTRGLSFDDYDALWRWSTEHLEDFWASIWEYFDVRANAPYERVLGARKMPGTEWFPGARVSFAEHVFCDKDDDAVAIRHASELRELSEWTWADLRAHTAAFRTGLREAGVGPGDRVVAYLPNIPETIAAFLACASLGAVWACCSPDFGVRSVVDRFSQIGPTVLIAVDGYRYGGRDFDRLDVVAQLQRDLPTVTTTVVLPYLRTRPDLSGLRGSTPWDEFTRPGHELAFDQLPFDHPLWVVYSSGTTGLPKALVHSQGGILLDLLKWLNLHVDAQADDRLFWYTTTGWVMWNITVGMLLTPASIVIYDGSPGHPDLGVLWDLAECAGITTFGTSAAFIASCMKDGIELKAGRSLASLRAVGSTGSPLTPQGFQWIYHQLGDDTWLFSISGGTDVVGPIVGGMPTLPVHLGEIQARILGVAAAAWDPDGRPVVGRVGELVITEPLPSMPIHFWGDRDGRRYHDSYFAMYPGVWRHGDWIEFTPRGTSIIHGRSDATINRGGVRMGTSEIYGSVLSLPQIADALVVDVPLPGGEGSTMPMFIVLSGGEELTDQLVEQIKARIRTDCSPRHVPDRIWPVAEIPRTLTGKILEVPVKHILMGASTEQVSNRDSVANPNALDWFVEARDEVMKVATAPATNERMKT